MTVSSAPLASIRLAILCSALCLSACGDIERLPRQPNERPEAELVAPAFASVGETVVADASDSSDSDGVIVEYRFAFGDSDEILIGGEPTIGHVYLGPGDYAITLTVVDNRGGKASVAAPISIR